MDHTNTIARGFKEDPEELAFLSSVLGPDFSFPRAGVIRPGIMVPKKSCSSEDVKQYRSLVEQGLTWEEIEEKLGADGSGKSKLVPRNVDFFTIHPGDCANPENAQKIHSLYADSDGKLRSIPAIFPVNEWWKIIPHSLRCFGANGIKFKSDFRFIKEGGRIVDAERVCVFPLEVEPGKKVFGGRKWGERPCDPDACAGYQKGECVFGGVIQFLIPGIPGLGVWMLPTTSWYSLKGIRDSLNLFSRITGGRISGAFGSASGIFRIRKKKEKISRIDPATGKAVRTEQWLITLDADVDLTGLALSGEGWNALKASRRAAALLSGETNENSVNGGGSDSSSVDDASGPAPARQDGEKPGSDTDGPSEESGGNKARGGRSKGSEGRKELAPSAQSLWKAIAKLYRSNAKRKAKLKELTGADSFYDLTEEEARKGLEALASQVLNRY